MAESLEGTTSRKERQMTHTDLIIAKIDRCLDEDRDPLDPRTRRCIALENLGDTHTRRNYITQRALGSHV